MAFTRYCSLVTCKWAKISQGRALYACSTDGDFHGDNALPLSSSDIVIVEHCSQEAKMVSMMTRVLFPCFRADKSQHRTYCLYSTNGDSCGSAALLSSTGKSQHRTPCLSGINGDYEESAVLLLLGHVLTAQDVVSMQHHWLLLRERCFVPLG